MALKPIGNLLGASDELRGLTARARRQQALQAVYARCAPPELAASSRVKNLKNGTLVVMAANAATAAKLRQLAPTLAGAMRKFEPDVGTLRVEVLVTGYQRAPRSAKKPLGETAIARFDELARKMPDGGLKDAVARLVRHHK
ncbi:MAG TPA: DciA family protein [Burkholderiales bacterium]|nr:DciA family protein [Burkholderiales bacterium]